MMEYWIGYEIRDVGGQNPTHNSVVDMDLLTRRGRTFVENEKNTKPTPSGVEQIFYATDA
jgi:hypothetical protein